MSTPVQLTGGAFQDSEGNVLANGYLKMKLSQDGNVGGVNICAGIEITIQLDGSGNAVTSPAQSVWGNDAISPTNTFYRVTGYTAQGQPAWGPNNQQVTGSGTFNLGSWTPNSVISWTPPVQPVLLETNGTPNSNQALLNLAAGTNMSVTDVAGTTTFSVTGISGITLKTNGSNNSSQSLLNLTGSGTVSCSESGGTVTISGSGFAPAAGMNIIQVSPAPSADGSATADQSFFPGNTAWSQFNPGGVGPSFVQYLPAGGTLIPASSWTITIYQAHATSTLTFKAQIVKTAPGRGVILAQQNITFGGLAQPTFSAPGTTQTSDTISFPIDQSHDYYIVVDSITGLPAIGTPSTAQVGSSGYVLVSSHDLYNTGVGNSFTWGSTSAQPGKTWVVSMLAQS